VQGSNKMILESGHELGINSYAIKASYKESAN
jgi:hypothetical protein